jgi:hypothetical protein
MPKSAAERQREYRARRPENNDKRLNLWISATANLALNRLAAHQGITKTEALEQLILEADDQVLQTLELDTPEWDEYFERPRRLRSNGRR